MSKVEEEEPAGLLILLPCHICFRTFRVESLERHSSICRVVATKKRKVFDSFKQRVQDLPDVPKSPHPVTPVVRRSNSSLSLKTPSWKDNHVQLIKTVRAARTADHTRCPYCERSLYLLFYHNLAKNDWKWTHWCIQSVCSNEMKRHLTDSNNPVCS